MGGVLPRRARKHESRANHAPRSHGAPGKGRSDAILGVAFRLFADQGYTGVSIKDIANASRINSALIYYYFTNKDHLFVEALKYSVRSALARRRRLDGSGDDPVAELDLWFDTNEKLAKPLGQMLRLMLDYRASRRRSRTVERLIGGFYDTELGLLKGAIGSGIRRGVFRPLDAAKISLFVSTHLDGLVVAVAIRPDFDLPAGLRQMRKVLFTHLGYEGARRARRPGALHPGGLRVVA
jgi:AcrR family transcriptional regulator